MYFIVHIESISGDFYRQNSVSFQVCSINYSFQCYNLLLRPHIFIIISYTIDRIKINNGINFIIT